jgi:hypothetical protein
MDQGEHQVRTGVELVQRVLQQGLVPEDQRWQLQQRQLSNKLQLRRANAELQLLRWQLRLRSPVQLQLFSVQLFRGQLRELQGVQRHQLCELRYACVVANQLQLRVHLQLFRHRYLDDELFRDQLQLRLHDPELQLPMLH